MVGIYMFTNRCNGKSYIGQSVDIDRRYHEHKFRKEDTLFHSDLEYYGFHNFDFCVLEECRTSELNDKEIQYIHDYNTLCPNGYNATPGGNIPHTNKLKSVDDVDAIISYLKEDRLTNGEIGEIFGISDQMVSNINCGKSWKRDDIHYPVRDGRRISRQNLIFRNKIRNETIKTPR